MSCENAMARRLGGLVREPSLAARLRKQVDQLIAIDEAKRMEKYHAPQEVIVKEGNGQEHQDGDQGRQAREAGSRHRLRGEASGGGEEGGEDPEEGLVDGLYVDDSPPERQPAAVRRFPVAIVACQGNERDLAR